VAGPDLQLLGDRLGLAWTSPAPWHLAYSVGGRDVNVRRARARFAEIEAHLRWSILASSILFVWVMLVLPVLALADRLLPVIVEWFVVAAAAWMFALAQFFRAYARTHESRPPLEAWLTMALSPVSLMRAPAAVAFEAAAGAHPLAAAAALCDADEFSRIARLWWFDDIECRPKLEQMARERGVLERLAAPPVTWDVDAARFCPRCHATYTAGATTCSDCDGMPLAALPAALPAAQPDAASARAVG
jgi:hypothetical protein